MGLSAGLVPGQPLYQFSAGATLRRDQQGLSEASVPYTPAIPGERHFLTAGRAGLSNCVPPRVLEPCLSRGILV